MNFVHIADMHFDVPFTTLNKNDLGNERRLEQREAFRKIIEYIKQNEIDYFYRKVYLIHLEIVCKEFPR